MRKRVGSGAGPGRELEVWTADHRDNSNLSWLGGRGWCDILRPPGGLCTRLLSRNSRGGWAGVWISSSGLEGPWDSRNRVSLRLFHALRVGMRCGWGVLSAVLTHVSPLLPFSSLSCLWSRLIIRRSVLVSLALCPVSWSGWPLLPVPLPPYLGAAPLCVFPLP